MALGTNHVTTTEAAVFIPELWSDEIIATYKKNLVLANLVTKMNHRGKKGDTIHIPTPTRGSATSKAAETQVTFIANVETEKTLTIDKHYHYARLIEDIVDVQALSSLRPFYTDDAGYALAKQVDTDLFTAVENLQGGNPANNWDAAVIGGDGTTAWNPAASTNTGNGSALTDAGIRNMIQLLDDSDVPMDGRTLVVPPVTKNSIIGIDRFVLWTNVGEAASANTIRNGKLGDIYGMEVFVSTNCPDVLATDGTTKYRAGVMLHKAALALVEQLGVRVQTDYIIEYLSDAIVADMIYGTGELRDEAGVAFIVPA